MSALVQELVASGESVDVITCEPAPGIAKTDLGPHGERIYFACGPERTGTRMTRIVRLMQFAKGVVSIGRTLDCSVVVSDPPPTAGRAARWVAKHHGAGFVYYMSDSWGGASKGASGLAGVAHPAIKWLEDGVIRRAEVVLAATEGMAEIARSAGASPIVVTNGVPTDVFHPDGPTWNPTGNGRPFFLYAGNAGVVHGATVFAEGAQALWSEGREFDLVYIGHGADFENLRQHARNWPGRIHVIGTQPQDRVAAAYRGAVGALSSLRPIQMYADARPIKSMAGLAAGCPAVYAGTGPFADLLTDNRLGFVTEWSPEGASSSLTAALDLHEANPERERELRCAVAAFAADNFSDRNSARLAAREVLATQRGARR